MTCFWDGLLNLLKHDFKQFQQYDIKMFIKFLKENIKQEYNVSWNDFLMSNKQTTETNQSIEHIDINAINHGYDCSTFEPVLFLICEILKINIIHDYNGVTLKYKYITTENIKTYKVYSNNNHFWI